MYRNYLQHMKKIRDFLHNLGLTETEINIYVKLLEVGRCSVSEIARTLDMNRVTAHFTIQGLIDKGLITHVKEGRSRELTAQPPEALQYLIEKKDKAIKSLHDEFTGTLPLLTGLMPNKNQLESNFDVKFYHGATGVRAIYREVLRAKELRSYVNVEKIFAFFPENAESFTAATQKKQLAMWEIIEDSTVTRNDIQLNNPENYHYKFFPKDWKHSNIFDYMIFDGKIAMIAGEKEPSGILVMNDGLFDNAVALFDLLWKLLPYP